jgi:hypothetical protein
VTEALHRGPDLLRSVGCAWYGVGVLSLDLHPAITALTCPFPAPAAGVTASPGSPPAGVTASPASPDCEGRDSGWFCSASVTNAAVECKGGAVNNQAFCADAQQQCASVSPSGDVVCQ